MSEKACYLCHDTNANIRTNHLKFPKDEVRLVECKACGNYAISKGIAEGVKADSQEKRLKLQQNVNAMKASPGQLTLIDKINGIINVRKIEDTTS